MNTILVLQNRSIKAAQEERWQDAQSINQEILEQDPKNISALNRLGFALLQDGKSKEAQKAYEHVLELDKANAVAKKYLEIIKKKQPVTLPKALSHSEFIDEPGKTKSVQLVRIASPDVLAELSIGSDGELVNNKSRVSVQSAGKYIGTLPDDLSSRLRPLLEAGNEYSVKIQSLKNHNVVVFLRELKRGDSVADQPSFPSEHLNSVYTLDQATFGRDASGLGELTSGATDDDTDVDLSQLDSSLDEEHEEEYVDFNDDEK